MSLCLTPNEVIELTGRAQPKRQIVWLAANGWKFEVGGDGLPKVARSYFDARMEVPQPKRRGPNLKALESANG